jgi:hypothetical protein
MKSTGKSAVYRSARALFRHYLREAESDLSLVPLVEEAFASGVSVRARGVPRVRAGASRAAEGYMFKFYEGHRHFNRWRPSRARMAWAAGRTLADLGVSCVEVVGFVERLTAWAPYESCLVMRAISDAITLREWVRRHHRCLDARDWSELRERLCRHWLRLGEVGIYHDDTKALNVLTSCAAKPLPDRFIWIDLESVRPGYRPGRRGVIRNLVQLNGSLRKWVPDIERRRFLEQAAAAYPWLLEPWVEWSIRRWTRRRLLNEVRTRCGP